MAKDTTTDAPVAGTPLLGTPAAPGTAFADAPSGDTSAADTPSAPVVDPAAFLDAHAVPTGTHRDYMAGQIKKIKKPGDLDAFLDEFANSDAKRTTMRKQLVELTGIKE